nr:hypothetical protein [uncultured Enterobacter sp.]
MNSYIIGDKCIYNESRSELKNKENSCTIRMTSMRARCLTYIIENIHCDIIEKKQIATALWGSRGQFVSDASLTQIIYLIRRDLKSMGVQDMFITVPRLGIKVNDEIKVERLHSDADSAQRSVKSKTLSLSAVVATLMLTLLALFILLH